MTITGQYGGSVCKLIQARDLDIPHMSAARHCKPTTRKHKCAVLQGVTAAALAAAFLSGAAIAACPELTQPQYIQGGFSAQAACNIAGITICIGATAIGFLTGWYVSLKNKDAGKVLCGNCRYQLRGLPYARCPECGTSFDEEWLHHKEADAKKVYSLNTKFIKPRKADKTSPLPKRNEGKITVH